jgi:hypothetical protein
VELRWLLRLFQCLNFRPLYHHDLQSNKKGDPEAQAPQNRLISFLAWVEGLLALTLELLFHDCLDILTGCQEYHDEFEES